MNPRFPCECIAAVREGGVAQFLEFVHRRKLCLERFLQVSFCVRGDSALRKIEPERSQRCHNHHDGREQSGAKTPHLFVSRFIRGPHGNSTCSVWPSFNSTGFSRVVLLSIHAFSVYLPGGSLSNRNRPAVSVITKYGVLNTRINPRICS